MVGVFVFVFLGMAMDPFSIVVCFYIYVLGGLFCWGFMRGIVSLFVFFCPLMGGPLVLFLHYSFHP